jgi:hypothetical protein
MKLHAVAIALVVAVLPGCVTTSLSQAGTNVRVTSNPDVVKGCKYIGEIVGRDRLNGGALGQAAAEQNADNLIKNHAAELGANVVFLSTNETGFSGSTKRGEGYSCP